MNMNSIYDIVGIGLGPSNLSLAALIDESTKISLSAKFLEKKPKFIWHENMLINGSEMQISFLKDLATLRNPSSPYTFLNYLHSAGRLSTFANLRTFYPSRVEFNDYFTWVAEQLNKYIKYSSRVTDIVAYGQCPYNYLKVIYENTNDQGDISTSYLLTRNIVVATGGIPNIPSSVTREVDNQRILHTAEYLAKIKKFKTHADKPYHFCVVGGGQSGAEVVYDLHQSFPNATISCVHKGFGLKALDESEFINEMFSAENVDLFYNAPSPIRKKLMDSHQDTNYAVVDNELIQKLYRVQYEESVTGKQRLYFKRLSKMQGANEASDRVDVHVKNMLNPTLNETIQVDALILATGYTHPNQPPGLESISKYFITNAVGSPSVTREHQVMTLPTLEAGIYLQGYNENTHGLTDTLLSISSVRAQDIFNKILSNRNQSKRCERVKTA